MDVRELFNLAFGVSSPVFLTVPIGKEQSHEINYSTKLKENEYEDYTAGDEKVFSDFGTEVIFPVWFEQGFYYPEKEILGRYSKDAIQYFDPSGPLSQITATVNNLQEELKGKVFMEEFRLPNATMVDFSRGKTVTRTNTISGGVVKEIFGYDDWMIRIRMLCITEKNRGMSAQEISNTIVKWSNLADNIPVRGRLFLDKDIHSICIEDIDIKSLEGSPNVVAIELQCLSCDSKENMIHYNK